MPRVLAGRYALEDELAVGGFAHVYRATDRRLSRPVAVKLLDANRVASADPGAMQRFVREARSSAGFTHPHAVTVYDAGEADGELFLVMELVDGPSLAEVIADRAPLAEDEAVQIATQVLSALGAAHASGIVHRDVKPANILLDARGDAKLADFGIAKRFDDLTDSLTATGLVIGTLRYISPEQAKGEPLAPAADVYAVGVILHEMLTGAPPFADESLLAAANRERQPVPRVDDVRHGVTPSVADATARALEPRPADRFSSADEMTAALLARPVPSPTALPTQPTQDMATRIRPAAATEVMPRPPATTHRPLALAIFVALCVIGVGVIVLALRDDSSGEQLASATDTSAVESAADIALTTPSTTLAPETTAAVAVATAAPETVAPETVAPTEPPPPTEPPVPDLVPGFPVPEDLETFHAQLANDPSLLGRHGADLEAELDRLLGERSGRKQTDRARELINVVDRWADEGELEPAVADHLIALLAPLADRGDGDDDD